VTSTCQCVPYHLLITASFFICEFVNQKVDKTEVCAVMKRFYLNTVTLSEILIYIQQILTFALSGIQNLNVAECENSVIISV
jgi:hypothetical protein